MNKKVLSGERTGRLVTMYGSTAETDENISCQDICVFYHRVTGVTKYISHSDLKQFYS